MQAKYKDHTVYMSCTCNFGLDNIGLLSVTTYLQVSICLLIYAFFTFSVKTSTKKVQDTSTSQPTTTRPFFKWRIRTNFVAKSGLFTIQSNEFLLKVKKAPL